MLVGDIHKYQPKTTKDLTRGFTIIELLIVIVVIAILAAIVIVAYNGIQDRAYASTLQSDVEQAGKQLAIDYNLNGSYPLTLAEANEGKGIKSSSGTSFVYQVDNGTNPPTYCLSASSSRSSVPNYTVSPTGNVSEGACSTGLTANYYSGQTLSGSLLLTRTEATVNHDWGPGQPDPSVPVDNFSVRWSGYVIPTVSGTYTFTVTSDDGERLYVNGSLIVDKWVDQGATSWSGTASLTAGQKVPIVYEMYENGGGALARLEWTPPSSSQEVIPTAALEPN